MAETVVRRPWWLADDPWTGDDKLSHLGWGAWVATLLLVAGFSPLTVTYWIVLLVAAVAVELVEPWRYVRWRTAVDAWVANDDFEGLGTPSPKRPVLCDLASYKDVAWVLAGGVLAIPFVLLARWIAL